MSWFPLLQIRDRRHARLIHLRCAAIAILVLAVMPPRAEAVEQTLLLELAVNGRSTGKIAEYTLRDGVLLARRSELRDLGFRIPDSLTSVSDGLIALSNLAGLTWLVDYPTQTLQVTAANDSLLPALLEVTGRSDGGGAVESGKGVTFGYDITGSSTDHQSVVSGLLDLRAFSPWGVASSGMLAYAGNGPGTSNTNSTIRLDTTYTMSDPATLRRYRIGDFINGGLSWTRPVRLGGVQVTSDFTMRPDLVTFPLPSISASVAVPSTVDLMVNATKLFSGQVQAGPFEIPQLPVVTGASTISMTVTNALGKQVVVTLPFYASSALLAPGLQTFSAQMGAVRRNWGMLSDDYGDPAASATYRRGVSSEVTVEASAEGTMGTFMTGGGVVVNAGNLAVINIAAALSAGDGHTGTQISAGVQRTGTVFSLGASAIVASRDFRDIAAVNGDPVPRLQLNAGASLSFGGLGSVGVAYAGFDRDSVPSTIKLLGGFGYFQPAQHAHVLTVSYSVQIRTVSIYATGFRDFANGGSSGMLVGLTMPFGARSSAGVSAGTGSGGAYGQVQVQQSPVAIGDWGYQAFGTAATPDHEFAQAQYKSPWALLTTGVDQIGPQTTLRVETEGAVSFVDGGLFASNTINDSFAVVDTGGLANVHVLVENRDVGSTDTSGRLLVPDLRSFDANHLAIVPTDVPLDTTIDITTRQVRPQDRSGVVVKFPVKISHGALLRLLDEGGKPVAVGSTATLQATGAVVPIGYDGEAYLQDLDAHNEVAVERADGRRCRVGFDYAPVPGEIPTIGPVHCQEQSP